MFGVKSIVRFKELQQTLRKQKGLPPNHPLTGVHLEEKYHITVEPRLPFLQASLSSTLMAAETSEDRDSNCSPTNAGSLVIYAGQRWLIIDNYVLSVNNAVASRNKTVDRVTWKFDDVMLLCETRDVESWNDWIAKRVFLLKCRWSCRHNFKVTLSNVEQIAVERIDLIKSSEDFAEGHLSSDSTNCLTPSWKECFKLKSLFMKIEKL